MNDVSILDIVEKEIADAQAAYEVAQERYKEANVRLAKAVATREFLQNLLVPTDSGPIRPEKLVALLPAPNA